PATATPAWCASASQAAAIASHTCSAWPCTAARRLPSSNTRCCMVKLVVETTHGKVRGEVRSDVAMWKGIPFAAPPVGKLRFRPPAPPVPWGGERDATQFGPVAQQSRSSQIALLSGVTEKVPTDEDCLVLNVFAPAGQDVAPHVGPADKHPVMVWIHGGAFVMGSGSTPLYHGTPFANDGIVVVTINYRLGLFGLLYLG